MPTEIERTIEEYRQRVLLQEAGQMRKMARRWLEVERSLEGRIAALAQELADLKAQGEPVSRSRLYQLDHYRELLAQAKAETRRYSQWAADLIAERQAQNVGLGIESAAASIRATYRDAGQLGAYFDLLPAAAVNAMIGFAGDGTPLGKLLARDYPQTVMQLTQALIDGTAAGRNPRETAKAMSAAMAGNLRRALTIARTEQLRAFRTASREQMSASGVVEGYIRRCALSENTCIACLALDGTEYETDELMEVHPEDRCFMQPKIKGLRPDQTTSGREWFEQQDEATQRQILGSDRYDLWSSGRIEFSDLASTHVDPTWGPTVTVTPLSEFRY